MTIRIILLSFLALFCFAATGGIHPSPVLAADPAATQPATTAAPDAPAKGEHVGERQQLKEELMKLPPDQRKARIEELRQQMTAEKARKLQQRKDEFQGKWDKASPEDREKFCTSVKQKCTDGGKKFACEIAQSKCAAGK